MEGLGGDGCALGNLGENKESLKEGAPVAYQPISAAAQRRALGRKALARRSCAFRMALRTSLAPRNHQPRPQRSGQAAALRETARGWRRSQLGGACGHQPYSRTPGSAAVLPRTAAGPF